MLESLEIKNFQRHKSFRLNLNSPISTITGPSDSGKSALLRAIKWALCNVPQGESFVKIGEETASVELEIDGKRIRRVRGKNENSYSLGEKQFLAFGGSVPDDISAIGNVGQTNFQGQFDSVFWFSQTAGEVSRQLNAVVDLGIIDTTISNIGAKVRLFQSEIQVMKKRLDEAKENLEKVSWVVVADKEYKEVERLQEDKDTLSTHVATLSDRVGRIGDAEKTRHTANTAAADCRVVGLLGVAAKTAAEKVESLCILIHLATKSEETIEKGSPDISQLTGHKENELTRRVRIRVLKDLIDSIEWNESVIDYGVPDVKPLEKCVGDFDRSKNSALSLKRLITDIQHQQRFLIAFKNEEIKAHDDLEKEMIGTCPVCGKEMS